MTNPQFHIHNLFDALNYEGTGVNGYLKLKCLQLQNRVIMLADSNDIVALSSDCPQSYIEYITTLKQVDNVLILYYKSNTNLRYFMESRTIFEDISLDINWNLALRRETIIDPYIRSASIYKSARNFGMKISDQEWNSAVVEQLATKMNDKAEFYKECTALNIPIPKYWTLRDVDFVDGILNLIKSGHKRLYVRQTRSAGAFGNITIEIINSNYFIPELSHEHLSQSEFTNFLAHFIRQSIWPEFIVSDLIDLYSSPGTLYYCDNNNVNIIAHTKQILNNKRSFLGFTYPIMDEKITVHHKTVEEMTVKLIEPWRQKGFRGFGNIDWMVSLDGKIYVAERNARQTAVVPPLRLINQISHFTDGVNLKKLLPVAIITRDSLMPKESITFEQLRNTLNKEGLLWTSNDHPGVVITIPPSPSIGIPTFGLMAIGRNHFEANEVLEKAFQVLAIKDEQLLLPHVF